MNEMQSGRNQNPPTGKRVKLLFSLYGQNSPKSHRSSWECSVKVLLRRNHKLEGMVEQVGVCLNSTTKNSVQAMSTLKLHINMNVFVSIIMYLKRANSVTEISH